MVWQSILKRSWVGGIGWTRISWIYPDEMELPYTAMGVDVRARETGWKGMHELVF